VVVIAHALTSVTTPFGIENFLLAVAATADVEFVVEELLASGVTSSLFVQAPKKRSDTSDMLKNGL
jgi:UTP-glucose-1-phosphate uridylyltransferase